MNLPSSQSREPRCRNGSLVRAEVFTSRPRLGSARIAARRGLPASTVHRIAEDSPRIVDAVEEGGRLLARQRRCASTT
ncbi:helix-turn-helix domain-containing protein [Acrocarpospora macrocephala]|uniref:helix-turn-helix domain-containing protein n=1 Tax=Acrocarpospora macrocephala TaxID=150177 RepID=UPI0035A21B12